MITFNVIKEQHGWAIRMGKHMTTPFWSKDLAVREANCLADVIRCHGECTEVLVESEDPNEPPMRIKGTRSSQTDALSPGHWKGGPSKAS